MNYNQLHFFCFFVTLVTVLLFASSCEKKKQEVLQPTFSSIVKNIFSKKCALYTCHSSAFYKDSANLNLMDTSSYESLVNVESLAYPDRLRVKPGDPDKSLLVNRLEGTVVVSVPLERNSMTDEEISVIRQWIVKGALNN